MKCALCRKRKATEMETVEGEFAWLCLPCSDKNRW